MRPAFINRRMSGVISRNSTDTASSRYQLWKDYSTKQEKQA